MTNTEIENYLKNIDDLSIEELWNAYVRASYYKNQKRIKVKNLPSFDQETLEKVLKKLDGHKITIQCVNSPLTENEEECILKPNLESLVSLRNLSIQHFTQLKGTIISDIFWFILKYVIYISLVVVILYFYKPEIIKPYLPIGEENSVKKEQKIKDRYQLTISSIPKNSRIKILNIKAKYHNNIELKPGRYKIEIYKKGYKKEKFSVQIINKDLEITKKLRKL